MVDTISKKRRSENMRRIKATNTKPELLVRKLLWSSGFRYRLHSKGIPGKPDVVFKGKKKAIFVHGCFWHQHDTDECIIVRKPKSNTSYWNRKLEKNQERDKKNQRKLTEMGWQFLVIWECDLKDTERVLHKLKEFLE